MNYESDTFRVRELREADADSLFDLYSSSIFSAKYISTLPHDTAETTLSKIKQWRMSYFDNTPQMRVYGVAESKDDFVFGLIVFVFNKRHVEFILVYQKISAIEVFRLNCVVLAWNI